MERGEPSGKHEVVKRGDKEKRAASAAPVAGRRLEEATVSPPLKTRKFESTWMMCREVEKGRSIF